MGKMRLIILIVLFLVKVGVYVSSFPENAPTLPVKDKTLIMNGLGVSLPRALSFLCLRKQQKQIFCRLDTPIPKDQ